MLIPVILSGGSGTRLWPLSRELYPKQLLPLVGKGTMLQETLARLEKSDEVAPPVVVCNESHRFLVAEQLLQLGVKNSHPVERWGEYSSGRRDSRLTCADVSQKMNGATCVPADH